MAFSRMDTKEMRAPDFRAYAVLNDSDQPVSENVRETMRNYDVHPIPWLGRNEAREELVA